MTFRSAFLLFVILALSVAVLHQPRDAGEQVREAQEELSGSVRFVVDGDTFHIGRTIIRVWGINSPEKDHPYYETARKAMMDLTDDQTIHCTLLGVDKYGRSLGRCRDESGVSLSSQMVAGGHAWDFTRYSNGAYKTQENQARREHLGLWASGE